MFTHVYFAKHFKHTATGVRIEQVACERCRTTYFYELSRVAVGASEAPYYTGQDAARQRAVVAAGRALAERLRNDVELVPCPKCNWVNESLVARYRRRRYRGAWPWIVGLLLGGSLAALLAYYMPAEILALAPPLRTEIAAATLAVSLAAAMLIPLVRRQLRLRIDPNQTHPRHPDLPPGTPPALLPRTAFPTGGVALLDPAPRHVGRPRDPADGAILRAGQSPHLAICTVCVAPSETTFRPPLKLQEASDLPASLCRTCASALRRRWWLLAVLTAVLGGAAYLAAAAFLPIEDRVLRQLLPGIVAVLAVPIAVATLPGRLCRPYRYRVLDGQRGVTLFSAENPEYTRQLMERHQPRTIPAPATATHQDGHTAAVLQS